MFKRVYRSLLAAVLFVLQGMAPLVHAHAGGIDGGLHGIHLDGLREALDATTPKDGHRHFAADESPGIGVATPRRDDERPLSPAQPVALACASLPVARVAGPAPAVRARGVPAAAPHLLPASRAPPPLRLT